LIHSGKKLIPNSGILLDFEGNEEILKYAVRYSANNWESWEIDQEGAFYGTSIGVVGGVVHVVYANRSHLLYRYRTGGGGEWSPPVELDNDARNPNMKVFNSGNHTYVNLSYEKKRSAAV